MIGLIYKTQPYQDNNKMLFVYSNRGKITLVAKGSQRLSSELRIVSQYLTLIEFYDNGKNMQPLREVKLLNSYDFLKTDYFKAKQAAVMLEALDKVRDTNLNDEAILNELRIALLSDNLKESALSFLIKLISEAGYRPNLNPKNKDVIGFNIKTASLVYKGDLTEIDLMPRQLIILVKLLNLDIEKNEELDKEDYEILRRFIKRYYEYHLNINLKNI
ncbi:MAG: DNA repair protein RecO [Acholeplasmataceae bacterium]